MSAHVTSTPDSLVVSVSTRPLHTARGHLFTAAHYFNQSEARDKICRVIQFVSKFISNGQKGVAYDVDASTSLARKVFRLLKSVNEMEYLLTPISRTEGLPMIFLSKSMHGLMATYFLLDNLVWAGGMGIYKNPRLTQSISNLSLYFFLGGCACSSAIELIHLFWKKKTGEVDRVLHQGQRLERDTSMSFMRLARSALDLVVGIGLLRLAPEHVTPRITGACGTLASLIACYEIYQATTAKVKTL